MGERGGQFNRKKKSPLSAGAKSLNLPGNLGDETMLTEIGVLVYLYWDHIFPIYLPLY